MTDAEVKRLRELCDKATVAPWRAWFVGMTPGEGVIRIDSDRANVLITNEICNPHEDDLEFIAAARTALPALLDEVERHRRLDSAVALGALKDARADVERLRNALVDIVAKIGGRPESEGPLEDEYARFAIMRAHKALGE